MVETQTLFCNKQFKEVKSVDGAVLGSIRTAPTINLVETVALPPTTRPILGYLTPSLRPTMRTRFGPSPSRAPSRQFRRPSNHSDNLHRVDFCGCRRHGIQK